MTLTNTPSPPTPPIPPTTPDWTAIAADYLAGHSLQALCSRYGVPRTTLWRRAHREGWQRAIPVAGRVENVEKERKGRKVREGARVEGAAAPLRATPARARGPESPAATQAMAARHQADIARSRALFQQLLGELETETAHLPLFEQLGQILKEEGAGERAQEVYRKAISMAARVDVAKRLMELLEKLVKLEREAFGLDSKSAASSDPGPRLEDFLVRLAQAPAPQGPVAYPAQDC